MQATGAPVELTTFDWGADRYLRELSLEEAARLRAGSDAVKYSTLREQIRSVGFVIPKISAARPPTAEMKRNIGKIARKKR